MLGSISQIEVQTKDLIVERLQVALRVDPILYSLRPTVLVEQMAETMAMMIRAEWRVPTEVVQDKEVARWPDGWWQALKWSAKGWWPGKLKVRFRYVTLREVLLYPTVPIPHEYATHVRLHWMTAEGVTSSE